MDGCNRIRMVVIRTWLAPDVCLDSGGSFNYGRWECTDEVNQYIAAAFYELKSFWLSVITLAGASLLQWRWRRTVDRPKALEDGND